MGAGPTHGIGFPRVGKEGELALIPSPLLQPRLEEETEVTIHKPIKSHLKTIPEIGQALPSLPRALRCRHMPELGGDETGGGLRLTGA